MAQAQISQDGDTSGQLTGVVVLFCAACLLGFAPILVKTSELGPQAIAFWRLTLSLPVLAVWLWFEKRRAQRRERDAGVAKPLSWKPIVLAGLFFAGDLAFWHTGIKITTAANATLLANLTPIIVAVAAFFLFGERITRTFLAAGALALAGAVLLSAANVQFAPERLPGDILSVLTSFWYASYLLAVRAARRAGAATVEVMFWSTATAAPILLLVTLAFGEPILPPTALGWMPLLALGIIVHAGGQGGIAFGLGRTPAALATLIILIQPVVAACAGWILFDEALVPVQWLGTALVLAGVYAAQRVRAPVSTAGPGPAKP
ncbi:MAG: DMT family transporter [Alphaproteobacteria bacterium]|nr:DMT family transporter [Alphaproteobacteria bacterium]